MCLDKDMRESRFLTEPVQKSGQWSNFFDVVKEKNVFLQFYAY
jgi:hypothetical protein